MTRGDLVTVAFSGDYGKPRPALVIQSDDYGQTQAVTVLPLTSHLVQATLIRVDVYSSETSGLRKTSQIMVDKITTVPRTKIGQRIGALDAETLRAVESALALFLALP